MTRISEPNSSPFGQRARVAMWYAIEEAFGGLEYDGFGEPHWSDEIETLEERVRKRLRILELAPERHIPEALKAFIVEYATPDQLLAVAEETLGVAVGARMPPQDLRHVLDKLHGAIKEGGIDGTFDNGGRFVRGSGVDTGPKAIRELPGQSEFKDHLAAQASKQIAVIFADLDNFKTVNDTQGHPAGDACLAKVVDAITGVIAGKGKLYRYGGDEFAVILQNADVDEAAATAERIRRAIQAARPGGDVDVTASVGVAASDQDGLHDPEKLLSAADRAVYISKQEKGKNAVTKWQVDQDVQPKDSVTPRERIKRLVELAEFGIHEIQNNRKNYAPEQLAAKRDEWEEEILETLEKAGATETEMSTFRVLGSYSSRILLTGPYKKTVNEVAEKVRRLRIILSQIEARQHRR